jgi:hypothetical protein
MDGTTLLFVIAGLLLLGLMTEGGRASHNATQRDEEARARSQAAAHAARSAFIDDVARRWNAGELSSADRDALLASQFMPTPRGPTARPRSQ